MIEAIQGERAQDRSRSTHGAIGLNSQNSLMDSGSKKGGSRAMLGARTHTPSEGPGMAHQIESKLKRRL